MRIRTITALSLSYRNRHLAKPTVLTSTYCLSTTLPVKLSYKTEELHRQKPKPFPQSPEAPLELERGKGRRSGIECASHDSSSGTKPALTRIFLLFGRLREREIEEQRLETKDLLRL